ncbi:MAG: protein kinase [Akkermansiaceae bacterium]
MEGASSNDASGSFEAPEPAELNALFSGYEISTLIACGGMGAVYLAVQKSLDRNVAIKILPREFGTNPQFRASFEREAKAMARLHHPNLIAIHDFGEADDFLYIVMEFVEGKSLYRSAHGIAIEQSEVIRLVHGISKGLAHAHQAGIIHRDIKPANILLDPRKRPRIGDFGLARRSDAKDEGLHFGSPDYIAPEALKDPSKASKRSDVYSVGVILYELLTGELPDQPLRPPSRDSNIDRRFDAIVSRALHPVATMRYADAEGMALVIGDLKEALHNPSAGLLTPASRKKKRAAPKAELLTERDRDPVNVNADATAMTIAASSHAKRTLHRNLVIIAALLVALVAMLTAYNRRKNEIKKDEELAKLESPLDGVSGAKTPPRKPGGEDITSQPRPRPKLGADQPLNLAGLKRSLANGDRSRFPEGTHELGEDRVFLVETAMSWQDANDFAESHGGHLATISNEAERATLSALVPRSTPTWLGGGTVGLETWGWVEGKDWALSDKLSSSTGNYLSLTNEGVLRGNRSAKAFPFLIQWQMDGDNPGRRDAQWIRLKNSLLQRSPSFPPGTIAHGKRRYFIMEGPSSWQDAIDRARATGGHLAVPSDETEWDALKAMITSTLPKGSAVWIGGVYTKGSWGWVTKEAWTFNAWIPKPPGDLDSTHTAIRVVPDPDGHAWDNADPTDQESTSAFIIEWSADQNTQAEPTAPAPPQWIALRKQTSVRLAKGQNQYKKTIEDNGRNLNTSLEHWYNNLDRRVRANYFRPVQMARETITAEGRIDETNLKRIPRLPGDIGGVCNAHLNKQRALDANFESALDKLRTGYLEKMKEIRAAAHRERIFDTFEAIDEEIDACEGNQDSFLKHFSPTP